MVSAVILNYLDPALTAKSVEHLVAAADEIDIAVEIIVVDNSAKQTADILRRKLPEKVFVVENEANNGFSKANNQGIYHANGDIILVMNNDLFINANTLRTGVQYIREHEKTGVWAPKLTDEDGNEQRSCSQFPTLTGLITEYLLKLQYDNRIAKNAMKSAHPTKVDTVIGACMFIPMEVMQQVGGFDEDYFFNVEDVDLCLKIKNRGYEVVFDSRCSAIHLVGASQDHHWHNNEHLHNARMLYFKKNHNALKAGLAKMVIKTGIKLRQIKHEVVEK